MIWILARYLAVMDQLRVKSIIRDSLDNWRKFFWYFRRLLVYFQQLFLKIPLSFLTMQFGLDVRQMLDAEFDNIRYRIKCSDLFT